MDEHLPAAFASLLGAGAPLLHYKVCSTFDSSPTTGSIGRALELGRRAVGARGGTPVIVGAPALKRYTAFGHLFAAVDGVAWRIDRHPTMSRHPVTPMRESDLVLHLGAQTGLPVRLFDLVALKAADRAKRYRDVRRARWRARRRRARRRDAGGGGRARMERCAGARASASARPASSTRSSRTGARAAGSPRRRPRPVAEGVDRLLTVSGSCSPTTAGANRRGRRRGSRGGSDRPRPHARRRRGLARRARPGRPPRRGRAARACSSPRRADRTTRSIGALRAAADRRGIAFPALGSRIGAALGRASAALVAALRPRRMAIAGGDTSGEVAQALGLRALTMVAPLAPGSPLCRACAPGTPLDGLEVTLKGGQVGGPDFFEDARRGRAASPRAASPPSTRRTA